MESIADQDGQIINLFKLKEGSVQTSCALPIAEAVLLGSVTFNRAQKVSIISF
jgi:DNA mismatch repair ATPase MutS